MEFIYKGNSVEIKFEEQDNDSEKRIVEQGIGLLKNIIRLHHEKEK